MILPKIYGIINYNDENSHLLLKQFIDSGIKLIQIRSKNISEEKIEKLCKKALEIRDATNKDVKIIINDYVSICKKLNADGVHLGQGDGDITAAREQLGPKAIIGLSNHTLEQLNKAKEISKALSYLALGPIFQSETKQGHAELVGTKNLKEATKLHSLPIVAIGGINKENIDSVFSAGASSVALISELKKAAQSGSLDDFVSSFK